MKPAPALLALVILHSSFDISSAAPPPELTVLRTQYEKVLAERVTAPFEANLADLNTKYSGGLDRAIATAKAAGNLDLILALEAEKKRLADKLPIPDDDDSIPAELKTFRPIYREQLKKLEEQRSATLATLLPAYTQKLKDLETTLVKNDRIEEAKEIKTYREVLALGVTPPPTETTSSGPPAITKSSTPASDRPARTFPPGDDRKAAEWVIALGCDFDVNGTVDGKGFKAGGRDPESWKLPPGEMKITRILIQFQKAPKKGAYKDLDPLAGLQHLEKLLLYNMPLTDDDADVFASLPKLYEVIIEQNKADFTGARLGLLAPLPNFQHLILNRIGINSKGATAVSALSHLNELSLEGTEIRDKDLPVLAKLTNIKKLNLALTQTTVEGLAQLRPLTQLTMLGWSPTPKKARVEFQLLSGFFPGLTAITLRSDAKLTQEDILGLAAFSALESVNILRGLVNEDSFSALAKLPGLKKIYCTYTDLINEKAFIALKASKSLEKLDVDSGFHITRKYLAHLGEIPTLKEVRLSRCPDLKPADIEAFKKQRPDVKVTQ